MFIARKAAKEPRFRLGRTAWPAGPFVAQFALFIAIWALALAGTASAARADALATPPMNGPLQANPNPWSLTAGPLGKIYVTGAVSGLVYLQNNVSPADRATAIDLTNAEVFVQKTEGWFQFFVQAGLYSLPSLGAANVSAMKTPGDTYGFVPQAYVTLAPTDNLTISAGKMPTLVGAEDIFTFENMNIASGLLSNQQNAITRGFQANYTDGPLSLQAAWNDGFYSDRLSWLWFLASYAVDGNDTITLAGGGNLAHSRHSSFATPLLQNNGQIYNLIYTRTAGSWTITPALQLTSVPRNASLGILHDAAAYGAAIAVGYALDGGWAVSARAEYMSSTGRTAASAPNLLYGAGSRAWSITLTPSFQHGLYFVRGEASYVRATDTTAGQAFGPAGTNESQARVMLETGILF
jgi:putative OmpL-like beta-barrel porin-2